MQIQEQKRHSDTAIPRMLGFPVSLRQIAHARLGKCPFALLQSLCTAVLTISGIRVAIGLSALAAASGIYAPARGCHQDAIRIPMLIVATAGAVVNLAVLAWIRHLRNRPSAQWRRARTEPERKALRAPADRRSRS